MSKCHNSNGARWIRAALQVNPYSYHGKVSPRNSFATEELYNQALIEELKRLNIEIIAVTDHWCINSATKLIREAKNNGITALPGFEANSSEGVHILIIFPEDTPFEQINAAIGLAGGQPGQESGPGTENTNAIINIMTQRGALAIPAHANTENSGLFKLRGKPLENIIKNDNLTGIAVSILDRDNYEETAELVFKSSTPYNRQHKLAKIYSDDICSPEHLKKISASTWLKLTNPTLDAIKLALKSPDTRVRLDEPKNIEIQSIDSISWSGGFLNDVTLPFNKELTTIIGGRGSGKSTIIESIRYVLNATPLASQITNEHESLIQEVVKPGTTIELKVTGGLATSKQYTICRTVGSSTPTVLDEDGTITHLEPKDIIEGVSIFGQHELAELTRDGTKLAEMLLKLHGKDISKFDSHSVIKSLESNLAELEDAEQKLTNINDTIETKSKYLEIINDYENSHQAELFQQVASIEAHSETIDNSTTWIETILKQYAKITNETIANIETIIQKHTVSNQDETHSLIQSQTDTIRAIIASVTQTLNGQLNELEAELRNHITTLKDLKTIWEGYSEPKLTELNGNIHSLQSRGIDVKRYTDAKSKLSRIDSLISQKESAQNAVTELEDTRSELLTQLKLSSNDLIESLKESVSQINRRTRRNVLTLVEVKEDKEAAIRLIEQTISGQKHKIRSALESTNYSLSSFIDDLYKVDIHEDESGLLEQGITDSQRANLAIHARYLIRRLKHLTPQPSLEVKLNTAVRGERSNFKTLSQLSKGQRATALLLMLLAGSTRPLIIDQPEDDLDNRFIYDGIVANLRKVKGSRQIIASTHNANIPVLGDAELVLTLHATNEHSDLDRSAIGSLDLLSVRENIEQILEGGVEAFSSRQRIYGF